MFERFSESTRQVIVLALEEAGSMNHDQIGTEHLLLGLLAEQGMAARILAALGVSYEQARAEVLRTVGEGETLTAGPGRQIPFSTEAKRTIEQALHETVSLGRNEVHPDSLLLALVRDTDHVASRILLACGVDEQAVRAEHRLQFIAEQRGVDMDRIRFDFSREEAFTLAGRLADLASEISFEVRRHGDREPTFRVSCELIAVENVFAGLTALAEGGIVAILDRDGRARLAHHQAH